MDGERTSGRILNRFEFYRSKIRQEVDTYMLREIYPAGTVIRDILVLDHHEGHSLGKQISSYSITARIPLHLPPNSFCDGVVVGHRERSLLVLPVPFDVNSLNQKAFEMIPGVSRKTAGDIILRRPFRSSEDFISFLESRGVAVKEEILRHCSAVA